MREAMTNLCVDCGAPVHDGTTICDSCFRARKGMRLFAGIALFALTGCAHTIPAGLEAAQRGLGAVDLGLDAATEIYVQAHDLCARLAPGSLPACDRLGDRSTVLHRAESLSKAYDATAEGLRELTEAYNEVAPHFEAAAAVVKDAGLFSR